MVPAGGLVAAAQPAELDHALEARGYTIITPTNVLTLDLEMPRMDGFTFLRIIMSERPMPVMLE